MYALEPIPCLPSPVSCLVYIINITYYIDIIRANELFLHTRWKETPMSRNIYCRNKIALIIGKTNLLIYMWNSVSRVFYFFMVFFLFGMMKPYKICG